MAMPSIAIIINNTIIIITCVFPPRALAWKISWQPTYDLHALESIQTDMP